MFCLKKSLFPIAVLLSFHLNAQTTDWLIEPPDIRATISVQENSIILDNGLIRKVLLTKPNAAGISLVNITSGQEFIRGIKPEASLSMDGKTYSVGGLVGQANYAFLNPEWIKDLRSDPESFHYTGCQTGPIEPRMLWAKVRHTAPNLSWPPKGQHLSMDFEHPNLSGIKIRIHYNLYEGIPVYSKWLELINQGDKSIVLNSFISEMIAAVESESWVESRGVEMPKPNIQVATDYQFGGMVPANVTTSSVFWLTDPDYSSQVNYSRQTPCLLEVKPIIGPEQILEPGDTFESFRAWVLLNDSEDKDRNSLALRKMYRVIAPWVTENPLMMHIRYSDDEAVKLALDQCAEVGFEMAIMTFGSGFNVEDMSPLNLATWKKWADYAHSKGLELGGYSLLSSRRISDEHDVINPETGKTGGVIHGNAPCLGSGWGKEYMNKLYRFYEETGMDLLEHDGSYPGHICASTTHPGHQGTADSQWNQWKIITDYYKWCRSKGIYLNVPDWFYLSGSTKNGMGYREVNWSLPREQQVIHTRQNIFDGTRYKTPSMGWMFVPLTEYHGGGAAATIEPLSEHLDHYEKMIVGNLANGVQACYRGPRLYDTEETRIMVKKWVGFYKKYRDILESDVIHSSSRRPDGRGLDWILHANPQLKTKGFVMVFNPTQETISEEIPLNLYYTGVRAQAIIRVEDKSEIMLPLNLNHGVKVPVTVPPNGFIYLTIE